MEETLKLILAAHVLALAKELRERAFSQAKVEFKRNASEPEITIEVAYDEAQRAELAKQEAARKQYFDLKRDFDGTWLSAHPVDEFIPSALHRLRELAALM